MAAIRSLTDTTRTDKTIVSSHLAAIAILLQTTTTDRFLTNDTRPLR